MECLSCGTALIRHDGERPYRFNGRRFCGVTCRNRETAFNNRSATCESKHCLACGKDIPRGNLKFADWKVRRVCNEKCKGDLYSDSFGEYVKSGRRFEHTVIAERALSRKLKKGEVVHHRNLNRGDNRPSNLLICSISHHAWIHWEIRRRKGLLG